MPPRELRSTRYEVGHGRGDRDNDKQQEQERPERERRQPSHGRDQRSPAAWQPGRCGLYLGTVSLAVARQDDGYSDWQRARVASGLVAGAWVVTRRSQVVVLLVTWDDEQSDLPAAAWDWTDLAGDECQVLAAGPARAAEETP